MEIITFRCLISIDREKYRIKNHSEYNIKPNSRYHKTKLKQQKLGNLIQNTQIRM